METVSSRDGTTIAYDRYGSGPALIYITGASGFRTFFPIRADAKTFAQEFTVYSYDRRGRGDSGNTLPYAVDREIEDIGALIDAAGGTANLYGHSSGAVLALEAALRLGPGKVEKAVLYDASYVNDEEEKVNYQHLVKHINELLLSGRNAKAMKDFLTGIGMPKALIALLPIMPGWGAMKRLAPTLAYDIALTEDLPPLERASTVVVPIHIAVGEKSPGRLRSVATQLAGAIPGATLTELAGQDHLVGAKALLPVLVDHLTKEP